MSAQNEIREQLTTRIVSALKAGTVPWRKPWSALENTGFAANVVSKRPYTGINPLLLELVASERGYQSRWWGTYNNWSSLKLQVKARPSNVLPGAWGSKVVFWRPISRTSVNSQGVEVEQDFFLLRQYTVFNAEQVEGAERFHVQPRNSNSFEDFSPAEEVVQATKADIRFGGNKACYFAGGDYITLPPKVSFVAEHEFYGTAFHELAHWTGHQSRLDRLTQNAKFGDAAYAREELVAEIAGCFLCTELGVPQSDDLSNHQAYLGHWLNVLEHDHSAIFRASSQSSKAVDYILAFSRTEPVEAAEAEAA